MGQSKLERLRDEVEDISLDLLAALSERARRTLVIGQEKRQRGIAIRDPRREAELLDRIVAANRGPVPDDLVRGLFRNVIDACVAVMEGQERRGLSIGSAAGSRIPVAVGNHVIGARGRAWIAGPCSVEDEQQMEQVAAELARLGVRWLRGGCFKPRTSPYAFQGLGERGLRILADVAGRHGLAAVTEATSPENAELVARYADVIQIGARNMSSFELLRAVGRTGKPVILKRGMSATVDEWLHAAEYVALSGSDRIILCERGIRTFSRETRNTLDVSAVPLALARSRLPVMADVSHAAGRRDILAALSAAAFAAGAHAVMVEVHPDPEVARSDAEQQLSIPQFADLQRAVAASLADAGAIAESAPATLPKLNTITREAAASGPEDQEISRATQRPL